LLGLLVDKYKSLALITNSGSLAEELGDSGLAALLLSDNVASNSAQAEDSLSSGFLE
jgi:hypothetical protein